MKDKMRDKRKPVLALFYCQNTPDSNEMERQSLEAAYRGTLILFPIPCSGRLDTLHILRALEEFADAAFVITCPEGACRYFEGNLRARNRVEMAKNIIAGIGLEKERAGIIVSDKDNPKTLATLAAELWDRILQLGPSPVYAREGHYGVRKKAP